MPTQLVEQSPELTARSSIARLEHSAHCSAVRTQGAVVRALLNELEQPGMEQHTAQLREQLLEEASRLAMLLAHEASRKAFA